MINIYVLFQYDRAVLDLGYVNNVGGGTALDNMVKIGELTLKYFLKFQ